MIFNEDIIGFVQTLIAIALRVGISFLGLMDILSDEMVSKNH